MSISHRARPEIQAMAGYQPGEQPAPGQRVIKLNTNENPYPAPEVVLAAIREQVAGPALRRYPVPDARPVREAAARAYGLEPDQVVVGNGSDDLLTMLLRTFVAPGAKVVAPAPTYSLYGTLTAIQGGTYREVPWGVGGSLLIRAIADADPALVLITRPNAPFGFACGLDQVSALCRAVDAPVVLDEAYADFADDNGLSLLADHPNLIVTRSFSKGFSLAGLRLGLGFAHPEAAAQLHKVRDSYNVDALAQAAATAALDNLDAYRPNLDAVIGERTRLAAALRERGLGVAESQANFLFARVPDGDGRPWYEALKARGVLIRYFPEPEELADGLRISVGTPEENDALLAALDAVSAG
ncbi:histidinol-phosphate transaminase [Thiohalorhabdus methylotrophus]|uniref:Histidinol-phosphate aminotransferase n=1 Tax=Thiohalorhabdus methylotrophus TaxID=3242694 RepID=A0ABV4TXI4_9GAMM